MRMLSSTKVECISVVHVKVVEYVAQLRCLGFVQAGTLIGSIEASKSLSMTL